MKILLHLTESANVRSITAAANKFIDTRIPHDLTAFYQYLSPCWFAEYMGLKKLVEKDYQRDEDVYSLSLTNI